MIRFGVHLFTVLFEKEERSMSCFRFTVRYFICRIFLAVVTLISVLFLLVSLSVLFLS